MARGDERRDDAVERPHVEGEAVQQHDRRAVGIAVLFVADIEVVGSHRARLRIDRSLRLRAARRGGECGREPGGTR